MKIDLKSISVSLLAITLAIPFLFSLNDSLSLQDDDVIELEYEEEVKDANESRLEYFKLLLDSGSKDGSSGFIAEQFFFLFHKGNSQFLVSDESAESIITLPLYLLFCNLKIYLA